jgi:glyoxylase-like metal-dependent hydrolase (beta-lactamase superfamily II)
MLYCKEENLLFTGDTLFKGSIGRTDFIGGSMFQIIQSLRMISQLPDETIVLPGHGEQTTMGYEQTTNPYLDR